jgi:hypothetical protein
MLTNEPDDYLYILLFTKRWSLLGNVNKMFMVGHIFDRSVGNLKPTIIFIWSNPSKHKIYPMQNSKCDHRNFDSVHEPPNGNSFSLRAKNDIKLIIL